VLVPTPAPAVLTASAVLKLVLTLAPAVPVCAASLLYFVVDGGWNAFPTLLILRGTRAVQPLNVRTKNRHIGSTGQCQDPGRVFNVRGGVRLLHCFCIRPTNGRRPISTNTVSCARACGGVSSDFTAVFAAAIFRCSETFVCTRVHGRKFMTIPTVSLIQTDRSEERPAFRQGPRAGTERGLPPRDRRHQVSRTVAACSVCGRWLMFESDGWAV